MNPEFPAHVLHFLVVSFVVALATAAIRVHELRNVFAEAGRFFLMIVILIGATGLVVFFLEWIFIRSLIQI